MDLEKVGFRGAIAIAVAAGLLAVALVALVWTARPGDREQSRPQAEAPQHSAAQAADEAGSEAWEPLKGGYTPVGEVSPASIRGLGESGLDDQLAGQLPGLLTWYFADRGDVGALTFAIEDTGRESVGEKVYRLTLDGTQEAYDLYAGTTLRIYPAAEPEAEKPAEQDANHDLGQQNRYGELNSSETGFDTLASWSLVDSDKVGEILPDAVSARLFPDLSALLSQHGADIQDPAAVMVSEHAEKADGKIRFPVLVYHGTDRIVVECSYALDGSESELRLMP